MRHAASFASLLRPCLGPILLGALVAPVVPGQEPAPFVSTEGRFSASMPGSPKHETVDVASPGATPTIQHQFTVAAENGMYLISYQDNPNLQGGTDRQIESALKEGRDALKRAFQGEVLEENSMRLQGKHPGLEVRLSIPAAKGEARCRLFLVGIRLYQVMAVGVPEFVASESTVGVLDSFQTLDDD